MFTGGFWDTAGISKWRIMAEQYYPKDGAVIVYDVTEANTLEDLNNYWIPNVRQKSKGARILLLGNKTDC